MKSLRKTWHESRIFPIFLISLIIIVFFILPYSTHNSFSQVLVSLFLATNLVLGVYAIETTTPIRYLSVALAFIVSTLEILNVNLVISNLIVIKAICWILIISILLYVFIRKVFETTAKSIYRIQGGIASYLLIGLLFAFTYSLLFTLYPLSFSFTNKDVTSEIIFYDFIYFSYVTISTVGFGDIAPLLPVSKSISILEAIIGVLFPTVLIGYLISDATSKKIN